MTDSAKKKLNALFIGAGGVASYLLPALLRSFDVSGILIDGDILEKRNLDRQLFSEEQIGVNKAEALQKHLGSIANGILYAPQYFDAGFLASRFSTIERLRPELIIVMVDNHPARKAALEAADDLQIPCILAANEYSTSQAYYYHPRNQGTKADPRILYPEILTDEGGSPLACQGEAAEASTPQLAIANQVSAALSNYLVWLWHSEEPSPDLEKYLPLELRTTFGGVESIKTKDLTTQ